MQHPVIVEEVDKIPEIEWEHLSQACAPSSHLSLLGQKKYLNVIKWLKHGWWKTINREDFLGFQLRVGRNLWQLLICIMYCTICGDIQDLSMWSYLSGAPLITISFTPGSGEVRSYTWGEIIPRYMSQICWCQSNVCQHISTSHCHLVHVTHRKTCLLFLLLTDSFIWLTFSSHSITPRFINLWTQAKENLYWWKGYIKVSVRTGILVCIIFNPTLH